MTAHTPGPWTLKQDGVYCGVVGANNETICDNEHFYPAPVSLPNARLIAAAPELLEALRAVLKGPNLAESWLTKNQYSVVTAAINKATHA